MKRQFATVRVCLFAILIPLVCLLGVPALGLKLSAKFAIAFAAAGGGALLVVLLCNLILYLNMRRKILTVSARTIQTASLAYREKVVENPGRARRRLVRHMRLLRLLNVCILLFWAVFACGACRLCTLSVPEHDAYFVAFLVTSALLILIAFVPILTLAPRIETRSPQVTELPLAREEYPRFYAVAEQAAKEAGYGGKFFLVYNLGPESICVREQGGVSYVALPPVTVRLFAEEELLAVLIHEFAHVRFRDTAWTERLRKFNRSYLPEGGRFLGRMQNIWFYGFAQLVGSEADTFTQFQSLALERRADEIAMKDHAASFVAAIAKNALYAAFYRAPRRPVDHEIYAAEVQPEDYFKRYFTLFEGGMPAFWAQKRAELLRTLPARGDTHPTLKMRMEAGGIGEPDLSQKPAGDYLEAAEAYLLDCGRLRAAWEDWEEAHADYVAREARMEHPEGHAKAQLLLDYFETEDARFLPLADELLAEHNLLAASLKGCYLAERDEAEGLALLREAAGDSPYFGLLAYRHYGDAVLRTGDEALLERARGEQAELAQRQMDVMRKLFFKLRPARDAKKLVPCDLPEASICAMRAAIADMGASEVFLAKPSLRGAPPLYFVFFLSEREEDAAELSLYWESVSRIGTAIFYPVRTKNIPVSVRERGIRLK